ncbi:MULTISPECIES: symmetrical bis(5'-nucleosyl)-tetraphosphatase [unclassified Psychrobacter]|uniref:symmetrical bis(5'-nucleosyl)-tetraphosphatase n=1 Tax=unclassified Psychrobacter TaxID=196806 RepID=UPI0025B3F486|nr:MULTISPECIES: symmetrical bis(5'-nucleosyl)-tetraphosphatase [unclassified Psychrobacter]MDN3454668.1 symmetrical bis(5'-nucleosyl)-tetraphosphatase [Psychrobacter sp. APC 3350]MDN3503065.1 symmetrical bis(5'-nucleosyl)-tetraphosphatase [Psychrobacter sp. 5A.1]
MSFRHQYVIGDLQGCYAAYLKLLELLNFDPAQDNLWFAGDLVARGEDSLNTLRHIKALCEQGAAATVLGNHDLNLIAVWRGVAKLKSKDKTAPIFAADDCDELLEWLRHQPLLAYPDEHTVLVHAGIPPHWSIDEAAGYAQQVEAQLQSSLWQLDRLLPNLYSKEADEWHTDIEGFTKMRAIANYFTRMRLSKQDGSLEFSFAAGLDEPMPEGFLPWFEWQVPRTRKILFGHWAALKGEVNLPHARALDGGCVWGNCLLAYRLSDGQVITSSEQCPKS